MRYQINIKNLKSKKTEKSKSENSSRKYLTGSFILNAFFMLHYNKANTYILRSLYDMKLMNRFNKIKQQRELIPFYKKVQLINKQEAYFEQLSDEQLREKTTEFKQLLANGKTINDLLIDAFAVVREATKRVLGLRHYDVQLIGGLVLLDGKISEMATGEGKTFVALLPSYLIALKEKGVHIITVNEYLAQRDKELMGQVHEFLGLTVGLNTPGLTRIQKQTAYGCDITYGVGTEFGFDFLRDNTVSNSSQKVQRPYHFAIIDEVDSILIDEARTPLIIARKTQPSDRLYGVCATVIKGFKENEDYTYDRELKMVNFKDQGLNKCEKIFGVDNLFLLDHASLFHSLLQALRARVLFERDVDYIVEESEIKLVDMNTGRIMEGRSLSDGLHQAIEAKEGLINTEENKTQASITIQNYYRMYPTLSGMTGTAKTDKNELLDVYNLDVVQIPTNKPSKRMNHKDLVYLTNEQKYIKIVQEVFKRYKKGQPILIGTTSILKSEEIGKELDKRQLTYHLLNAKSVLQEARLISLAGQKQQITIATNMAGRGTDIMLGDGVAELGGLYVIGTERNESKRIDDQLKGRAGRQGDDGASQFIISIEDPLFVRFGEDAMERARPKLKSHQDGLIKSSSIHKIVDSAQSTSEGMQQSFRSFNLNLEDVINDQRKVIYEYRDKVLDNDNVLHFFAEQTATIPKEFIEHFCSKKLLPEEWNIEGLEESLRNILLADITIDHKTEKLEDIEQAVKKSIKEHLDIIQAYEGSEDIQQSMRGIGLFVIDTLWTKHLDTMGQFKQGIGLHQYKQENPLDIFKNEGYALFETMYHDLQYDIARRMKGLIESMEGKEEKKKNAINE